MPERIQLRRKRGWKMPDNTVKVDRSTPWGNPFITSEYGTQEECVHQFILLLAGHLEISTSRELVEAQEKVMLHVRDHIHELKGKNLACWCRKGTPCHADVLLHIANAKVKPNFNLDTWFDQYKEVVDAE